MKKINPHDIAINFPHLGQIAAERRVALPYTKQRDIQALLKNSKMRPFIEVKTVRSVIAQQMNRGTGINGEKYPEFFKCWVFNRKK